MRVILWIAAMLSVTPMFAQQAKGKITGQLKDTDNNVGIEYATIALFSTLDSSLVGGTVSDSTGKFILQVPYGTYYLKTEFIGYSTSFKTGINLNRKALEFNTGIIKMSLSAQLMEGVEITADANRLQNSIDKKVFNVEKDISNIGGSAQDALSNIPSVDVGADGSVSLRGSDNVRILIDGKPSGLTGISSAAALAQIPANTIESIEIITNPSVKYDAEGMAGIINIVLKKESKKGLNGMVSGTAGWPQNHIGTVNINYGMKKVNINASYSLKYQEGPGFRNAYRETTVNDTTTYIDQKGDFARKGLTNMGKIGIDYLPNDKNTISASVSIRSTNGTNVNETEYQFLDFQKQLNNVSVRNSNQDRNDLNMDYALDYTKKFKKKGQKLAIKTQLSTGFEEKVEGINQQAYTLNFEPDNSSPLLQRSFSKEDQNTMLLQADYVQPIGKTKMETGYKSTIRKIDKTFLVEEFDDNSGNWFNMTNLSNRFIYDEAVHAAYLMFSGKMKKLDYQIGVRAEQTYVTSKLVETNEEFKSNYLNFFPSAHFSRELKGENLIKLSYSKRIKRPSYYTLNPFWNFSDPLNWWVGNPELQPEYTHSFELSETKYWKKSNLNAAIYYRYTTDVIQRIKTIDSTGVSTTKPFNMSNMQSFGIEASYTQKVGKWWRVTTSANYFRTIIDGGNIGEQYATDFYSWTAKVNSNIKFKKGWSAQQMFNYRAPKGSTQGTRRQVTYLDLSVNKEVWKGKGTLTAKVSDVFNSKKFVSDIYGDNFYIESTYQHLARTFYLSFSYKFNNYKARRKHSHDYDVDMF